MTDDLVERLRDSRYDGQLLMRAEAADRIEELEDALQRIAKANNSRDRYSPVIDAIIIWAFKKDVE